MSVWDLCTTDDALVKELTSLNVSKYAESSLAAPTKFDDNKVTTEGNITSPPTTLAEDRNESSNIDDLQLSLLHAEHSCDAFISDVDEILTTLTSIDTGYNDVTGRTNTLIVNCETVLEQQRGLEVTVDGLKKALRPFDDLEEVATALGVTPSHSFIVTKGKSNNTRPASPLTALGMIGGPKSDGKQVASSYGIDPRSVQFKTYLYRLGRSIDFISINLNYIQDFKDRDVYMHWIATIQNRAVSLISKNIRDLLMTAAKQSDQMVLLQAAQAGPAPGSVPGRAGSSIRVKPTIVTADTYKSLVMAGDPLETLPMYKKYRGLVFRVRDLMALLDINYLSTTLPAEVGDQCDDYDTNTDRDGPDATPTKQGVDNRAEMGYLTPLNGHNPLDVLGDLKSDYISMRISLLRPFVTQMAKTIHHNTGAMEVIHETSGTNPNSSSSSESLASQGDATQKDATPKKASTLNPQIRQAYSNLLRVAQLEVQLFEAFFVEGNMIDEASPNQNSNDDILHTSTDKSSNKQTTNGNSIEGAYKHREVLVVLETMCSIVGDSLRPSIIHETDVDELCGVVAILAEDVRSHMKNAALPRSLLKELLKGLSRTVNDAKERLSYVSEMELRRKVTDFKPMPSHLAYPDILEAAQPSGVDTTTTTTTTAAATNPGSDTLQGGSERVDVARTWYPPLRHTLSLLSKLYGVVDSAVFEDFARRAVFAAVTALRSGCDGVSKNSSSPLHGDLFMVRHLLILREQLIPFDIRLQGSEKALDFQSTSAAFSYFTSHGRDLLRFDNDNGLLKFAREGLPQLNEVNLDVKRDLDRILKNSCLSLKASATDMLFNDVVSFIAKVEAFSGEIPILHDAAEGGRGKAAHTTPGGSSLVQSVSETPQLASELVVTLRAQAFMRMERLKEVLDGATGVVVQNIPDLKQILEIYIDSPVARAILLKPVQQEMDVYMRKVECVVHSCVEPGQHKRDLEQAVTTLQATLLGGL